METTNKIVKKIGASFLTTFAILAGMGVAYAAWSATETSWIESSFDDGKQITNNMLSGPIMGYVKNSSGQKIYWRKFNTTTYTLRNAQNLCDTNGMTLPTTANFANMYYQNYYGIDSTNTYVQFRSMNTPSVYHWTKSKHDGPSWNAYYHDVFYPSGLSWTYVGRSSSYQVVCVYKN